MRGPQIQQGVPIPPISRKGGLGLVATLRKMKRGDSVRFPKERQESVTACAGKTFGTGNWAVRSNGSHIRVWRTK